MRIPWLALALLSATALAYEVLLTRLFAIIHWHHLAATIISLALLGYGASGTFLTLLGRRATAFFGPLFVVNATLFAISLFACFVLAGRIQFDPLALAWSGDDWSSFAAIFMLMAVPFFAVANCIGLCLWRFEREVPRIYAVDLAGAGLGPALLIAAMADLAPEHLLHLLAGVALAAGVLGAWALAMRRSALALIILGGALWLVLADLSTVRPAPYKDLARALTVLGARVEAEQAGRHGVVTVVDNETVPVRQATGLSLRHTSPLPRQKAVFLDADAAGVLIQFDGRHPPAYLRDLTSAAPYALLDSPRVLVLEAGAGESVLQALAHGASEVHAVEWHGELIEALRTSQREFSGDLYRHPAVHLHETTARAFLARSQAQFDLIELRAPHDPAGLGAVRENYALTVEAFAAAIERLAPGGVLTLSATTRLPPPAKPATDRDRDRGPRTQRQPPPR